MIMMMLSFLLPAIDETSSSSISFHFALQIFGQKIVLFSSFAKTRKGKSVGAVHTLAHYAACACAVRCVM